MSDICGLKNTGQGCDEMIISAPLDNTNPITALKQGPIMMADYLSNANNITQTNSQMTGQSIMHYTA